MKAKKEKMTVEKRIRVIEISALVVIFVCAIVFGEILGLAVAKMESGEDIRKLDDYSDYELPTEVYDIRGEKITEFFIKKRAIVPYHRLPQNLINALIAMEDTRFYQHKGVDSYRIAGAMVQNIITSIKRGKWTVVQGGSTVTQQLAKLLFTSRERTFGRKIVELWMTLQIEKRFTKPEILEKYFNQIYFNHGVYGVEMASQFYFGKKVEDISLAECAMLVSIPPAPERYSPFRNPDNARKKQKLVLKKMVDMGFATKEEAAESITLFWDEMNERLVTKEIRSALHNRVDEAPYFSEYVRLFVEKSLKKSLKGMVEEDLLKENRKMSAEELEDEVEKRIRDLFFTGGFKVYTTLDLRKQRAARKHLKDQLEIQDKEFRHQSRWVYHGIRNNYSDMASLIGLSMANPDFQFHYKRMQKETLTEIRKELNAMSVIANTFGLDNVNRLVKKHSDEMEERNLSLKTEGALISMNPNTGHIVSMVGGRKFSEKNRLNRVVDIKRQPGSAFKAFVYGAAINSKSLTPSSVLVDEELKFFDVVNQIYWTPGNADQEYLGPIPLRTALKLSVNTIAVKIVNRIGAKAVVNFVTPIFGLKPERFRDDTSIALGTSELTPFEMCEAISVYANGGRKIKPVAVLRVMDRHGREIYTAPKNKSWNYVVSPQVAFLITDMLKGVVTSGTASGAVGEAGFHRECAGKTGSTQDSKDAWFVGYTPNLATVVWVGFDRGGISLGRNQFGGTVAAPVWARFMRDAHRDLPVRKFIEPRGLSKGTVCRKTGLAQSKACKEVHGNIEDYFLPNTYPSKKCKGHSIGNKESDIIDKTMEEALKDIALNPGTDNKKKNKGKPINSEINKHFQKELVKVNNPDGQMQPVIEPGLHLPAKPDTEKNKKNKINNKAPKP